MPLTIPDYINKANIQDTNIKFKWDDDNFELLDKRPADKKQYESLEKMSLRAVAAFNLGTVEWIIRRFELLENVALPLQFLEACWAALVDLRYCGKTWDDREEDIENWTGSVRGPLGIVTNYAFESIGLLVYDDEGFEHGPYYGSRLFNMACYLVNNPEAYTKWSELILPRLENLYPIDRKDLAGEMVPREALDPDFHFTIDQTESLTNKFLSGLNYKNNPFLNAPEGMFKYKFEGTPYIFNITQDRQLRKGWIKRNKK